jgi:hypothetical protein
LNARKGLKLICVYIVYKMISDKLKDERNKIIALAKKERNQLYYQKQKENRKTCDVCNVEVLPSYWNAHVETKRHLKWASLKNTQ